MGYAYIYIYTMGLTKLGLPYPKCLNMFEQRGIWIKAWCYTSYDSPTLHLVSDPMELTIGLKQEWWFYRDIPWDITESTGTYVTINKLRFIPSPVPNLCFCPSVIFVFWAFIGGGKPSFLAQGLQEKEKDALDKLTRRLKLRGYCGLGHPASWMKPQVD